MSYLQPRSTLFVPARGGHIIKAALSRSFPAATALAILLSLALLASPGWAQQVPPPSAAIININTADAQSLAEGLSGIGLAKAEEIIRHREAYGPFASVQELAEVKGIGQSTLDKNRTLITLE